MLQASCVPYNHSRLICFLDFKLFKTIVNNSFNFISKVAANFSRYSPFTISVSKQFNSTAECVVSIRFNQFFWRNTFFHSKIGLPRLLLWHFFLKPAETAGRFSPVNQSIISLKYLSFLSRSSLAFALRILQYVKRLRLLWPTLISQWQKALVRDHLRSKVNN